MSAEQDLRELRARRARQRYADCGPVLEDTTRPFTAEQSRDIDGRTGEVLALITGATDSVAYWSRIAEARHAELYPSVPWGATPGAAAQRQPEGQPQARPEGAVNSTPFRPVEEIDAIVRQSMSLHKRRRRALDYVLMMLGAAVVVTAFRKGA